MIRKILSIMLIYMLCLSIFSFNVVFADEWGKYGDKDDTTPVDTSTPDGVITGADSFLSDGEEKVYGYTKKDKKTGEEIEVPPVLNTQGLVDASNFIYNLLLAIAMIAAMAIGIAIGIKFMMASATEKAEVKELLWPYVLGCIVVFGAMGIWKLAVSVFSGF